MLQAAISETTAPCPKCRKDMVLAVVIPHPAAPQLARHTYLCTTCNQTKTYILQVAPEADGAGADGDPGTRPRHAEPDNHFCQTLVRDPSVTVTRTFLRQ